MHHYCTYFDSNYLLKGLALISSLQAQDPDCHIDVICLDDNTRSILLHLNIPDVRPIPLSLLEKADPEMCAVKNTRSLVEYYWTMTPSLLLHLLEGMPDDEILTYVDADIYFWSSPQPLFDELGTASILIHTHNFPPAYKRLEIYGIYNVGLLCFRKDAEGEKVLRWWRKKCLNWCGSSVEADPDGGQRYGDQKYLERFAEISSAVHVCTHPGAGVAPWNQIQFHFHSGPNGNVYIAEAPVIFYHYHSFTPVTPECAVINTHLVYKYSLNILRLLVLPYFEALQSALNWAQSIQADFNTGYKPEALDANLCIIGPPHMQNDFQNAGFDCIISIKGSTKDYIIMASPQLVEYPDLMRHAAENTLQQQIERYHRWPQKKRLLNLGCGSHWHRDWLNIDIAPTVPQVIACDLRQDWPLPRDFFDMVYHSHVLEHMDFHQGKSLLQKCLQVLKQGGILRIAVPDLESTAREYLHQLDAARAEKPGATQRHQWMIIELIDQLTRHRSGGEMLCYLQQHPVPEENFILTRIGSEGEHLIHSVRKHAPTHTLVEEAVQVGMFRLGGEVHRWMYDSFSLKALLEEVGFVNIQQVSATQSALPNFADYHMDHEPHGVTRKPDSFFMEAHKAVDEQASSSLQRKSEGSSNAPHPLPLYCGEYPDWHSAVAAAGGYDSTNIFEKVRAAARAVRDGKALWERDSVLFFAPQYNEHFLQVLLDIAQKHAGKLHVLDFGGALGSTYVQHRTALAQCTELTWNIVEQPHVVECGQQEFTAGPISFFHTVEEALEAHSINVILFSSVLQYLDVNFFWKIVTTASASGVHHILVDRTPFMQDKERFTVQRPDSIYPGASHAVHVHSATKFIRQMRSKNYACNTIFDTQDKAWIDFSFHGMLFTHIEDTSSQPSPTQSPLRIMQADMHYSRYITDYYQKNPHLQHAGSAVQEQALVRDGFSAIHAVVPYINTPNITTSYCIYNNFFSQSAWAKEQGLACVDRNSDWQDTFLRQRIEHFKPDVLYLADPLRHDANFLASLTHRPRLILAWRAADVPFNTDWTGYDSILSGLTPMLHLAPTLGAKKGIYFIPGMPTWLAREVETIPHDTDVIFVGSLSPTQHVQRHAQLDFLAQAAAQHGFSLILHLACNPTLITKNMRPYVRPPVFGVDMHRALRRGRIVVDTQGSIGLRRPDGSYAMDLAQGETVNMRLFEATGVGSLVLTEHLSGLHKLFVLEKEVVTYQTPHEMVKKILYFLEHEDERKKIADAGKVRCLGEWNMQNCAEAFLKIVQSRLQA